MAGYGGAMPLYGEPRRCGEKVAGDVHFNSRKTDVRATVARRRNGTWRPAARFAAAALAFAHARATSRRGEASTRTRSVAFRRRSQFKRDFLPNFEYKFENSQTKICQTHLEVQLCQYEFGQIHFRFCV